MRADILALRTRGASVDQDTNRGSVAAMTRRLTVLLAALEAVFVVAIGVAIPLVPLTIVWAAHFGFGPDWLIFWRASVDVWLVGHGVDITFTLDPVTAAALGIPGAEAPVLVTIALLGFALVTLLLGVRAGRRISESGHRTLGELGATGVFALASLGVTMTAVIPSARPSIWQGVLLPTLVFALGLLIGRWGAEVETAGAGVDPVTRRVAALVSRLPSVVRVGVVGAARAGVAAVAATVAVSALATAALIVTQYAEIIRLYESLHTEIVGGIAVTAAQLALLPDLVVWTASWFVGPGFAIGTGSQVSPVGTALGPLPSIPVLGAIPTGDLPLGFAGLLVPVVAGFFAGIAARRGLGRALDGEAVPVLATAATAIGGGVAGGVLMGLLAWGAAGSAGPGRLIDVGPDPLAVGIAATLEFALAIGTGMAAAGALPRTWRGIRSR